MQVERISPFDGAVGVAPDAVISVILEDPPVAPVFLRCSETRSRDDVQGTLAVDGRRILFEPVGALALLRSYDVELTVNGSTLRWSFATRDGRWGKRHDFGRGGADIVVSGDSDGAVLVASDCREMVWTAFSDSNTGWEEAKIVAQYSRRQSIDHLQACLWRGVAFLHWVEYEESTDRRGPWRFVASRLHRFSRGTDLAWQRAEAIKGGFARFVQGMHHSGPSALCGIDGHFRLVELSQPRSHGIDLGATCRYLVICNPGEALYVWLDSWKLFARRVTENDVGPAMKLLDPEIDARPLELYLTSDGRGQAAVFWVDGNGPLSAGRIWWCHFEQARWRDPELLYVPNEDCIQPRHPEAALLSDGRALLIWHETDIDRNRGKHTVESVEVRSPGHLWVRELDGVVFPLWNIRGLVPCVGPDDNGFFCWGGTNNDRGAVSEYGLYAWRVIDGKPATAPELVALARPGHTIMDVHPVIDHRGAATVVVRERLGNDSHIFACRFD